MFFCFQILEAEEGLATLNSFLYSPTRLLFRAALQYYSCVLVRVSVLFFHFFFVALSSIRWMDAGLAAVFPGAL